LERINSPLRPCGCLRQETNEEWQFREAVSRGAWRAQSNLKALLNYEFWLLQSPPDMKKSGTKWQLFGAFCATPGFSDTAHDFLRKLLL
jgi:hypothetical protein